MAWNIRECSLISLSVFNACVESFAAGKSIMKVPAKVSMCVCGTVFGTNKNEVLPIIEILPKLHSLQEYYFYMVY